MAITGSCLCGAVRYEITGPFKAAGHCHCSMCRKSHGAAFATWAHINPDQFRWITGVEFIARYESSPGKERCFCRKCGSPLGLSDSGKITEVVLGTVDGDPGVRPGEHIFVGSKAPWYDIVDALPQYEEWPREWRRNGGGSGLASCAFGAFRFLAAVRFSGSDIDTTVRQSRTRLVPHRYPFSR